MLKSFFAKQGLLEDYNNYSDFQTAIKEIVEVVIDKCAEEANVELRTYSNPDSSEWIHVVDRNSILNVKQQIQY